MWHSAGSSTWRWRCLVTSGLVAGVAGTALAQDTKTRSIISGRVVDANGDGPVSGARINLVNVRKATRTDSVGRFRFDDLKPGVYQIEAVLIGLTPLTAVVRLEAGERKDLEFRTDPAGQLLPTIFVDGESQPDLIVELTRFDRRRALGAGRFITRAQIVERRPFRLMDMIRFLPGVRTNCSGTSCQVRLNHDPRNCGPAVFVDDVQTSLAVLESTNPNDVQGVEIYRGPSETPPEINNEAARCGGAIVIWTRRGLSP